MIDLWRQFLAQSPAAPPRTSRMVLLAVIVATLTLGNGCVYRRLTIRSDPPGALVLLDGEEVGYTPYTGDFTYYGTREIKLVSPGYQTLTVQQPLRAPWYQIPPLDFISDNFLPYKVTNRHDFTYRLRRQDFVPSQELIDRANSFRSESEIGQ